MNNVFFSCPYSLNRYFWPYIHQHCALLIEYYYREFVHSYLDRDACMHAKKLIACPNSWTIISILCQLYPSDMYYTSVPCLPWKRTTIARQLININKFNEINYDFMFAGISFHTFYVCLKSPRLFWNGLFHHRRILHRPPFGWHNLLLIFVWKSSRSINYV